MNRNIYDQLCDGPHLIGYSICHNDHFRFLQINGRLLKLSPTEYLLCMRVLRHFEWLQQASVLRHQQYMSEFPNVYVTFEELQLCANLPTRPHVTRHLSNVNSKLKVHGISIICVGECGYTLNFQQSQVGYHQPSQRVSA
jgi:hypothetical protein